MQSQLCFFDEGVKSVDRTLETPKPERKPKRGTSISDYGTLREWERDLTPCERRRYLAPFPRTGRTWATFGQNITTPWGWFGRHYEQGSDTMHIWLFRRNGA